MKYKLLPHPWHTNCTEYGLESKMYFISQFECYSKCVTRERKKICGCLTLKDDDSHLINWISPEDQMCKDDNCPERGFTVYALTNVRKIVSKNTLTILLINQNHMIKMPYGSIYFIQCLTLL